MKQRSIVMIACPFVTHNALHYFFGLFSFFVIHFTLIIARNLYNNVMNFTPSYAYALDLLKEVNPIVYTRGRNYENGSTKLSPYITRGVLTLPQVRASVLENYTLEESYKFIYELAWREYWQREWWFRGDTIRSDIKRVQPGVESNLMPVSVIDAKTGIDVLDTQIGTLYETGYMFNHARMWLSGLICNIAHTHWWQPSLWLYYHLLDGDPASNSLSWQWVASTFGSKQYLPAQSNINAYTDSKQRDTYLDNEYSVLADMETPKELQKRIELNLVWQPPQVDDLKIEKEKPTLLYHSFWLNQEWHRSLDANRILVLEPSWFELWPVSDKVTQFIISLAREIPGMQVYIGEFDSLDLGVDIRYKKHQSVTHWKGKGEDVELLFPDVPKKSYNSFTSFWKQCEKFLNK
jgi:deoxyribodipyrimidine photo-lyase